MIRHLLPIALQLLLFYFLIGHVLLRWMLPRRRKNALMVRDFLHQVEKIRLVNGDLLPPGAVVGLDEAAAKLREFRKAGDFDGEKTARAVRQADESVEKWVPESLRKRGVVAEYLEIILVALGVAFGIRAAFLQPFKIPTGSMQPTLYGIHFIADEEVTPPNPLVGALHYLHSSRRYVDETVSESGFVRGMRPAKSPVPILLPRTVVIIGTREYILPGKEVDAVKCNPKLSRWLNAKMQGANLPIHFEAGEPLAKGYLMSGDHLFVNRTAFSFREPRRGDITVFKTDGIIYNGVELRQRGRYYIKRLVGMPGDEIRIKTDGTLAVREAGEAEFRAIGGNDSEAFRRIYSDQGGYHGYIADMGEGQNFLRGGDVYVLPENHYFMLGDNSRSSLDSRFWGSVPRANLVGKASLIWWPTTRRWGLVDTVEPDTSHADKASGSGRVE